MMSDKEVREEAAPKKRRGFKESIQALRGRIDTARDNYKAGVARDRVRQVEQNAERLHELKAREEVLNSKLRVQRTEKRLARKSQALGGGARGGPMGAFTGLLGGLNEAGQAASRMGPVSGMDDLSGMANAANKMTGWPDLGMPQRPKQKKKGRHKSK